MKVNRVESDINFKSGLTQQIVEMEQKAKLGYLKRYFNTSKYRDWRDFHILDFNGNKAYALASKMTTQIFIKFKKMHDYRGRYSMQNMVLPHGICVCNENELTAKYNTENPNAIFSVNWFDTSDIVKGKHFEPFVILMKNIFNSLEQINEKMDKSKNDNFYSSSHFLHFFIHEFIHSIQGKIIKNFTSNYSYDYQKTINNYSSQSLSDKESKIVADVLGEYASQRIDGRAQYPEVFAEAWTKFICESLDDDCVNFKRDPLEQMKQTPKSFRTILKKVSKIDFYDFYGRKYDK